MRFRDALVLTSILTAPSRFVVAEEPAEPPVLTLPIGSSVRMQTLGAPEQWVKGVLVSADPETVALLPEGAPVLGATRLRLPRGSLARLEVRSGSRRQWLVGLLVGSALGLAVGASADVAADDCGPDSASFCSRGEAVAASVAVLGGMGAGVGALVKRDRWLPVALDALAPPAPRVSGLAPRLRTRHGGFEAGVAFGF